MQLLGLESKSKSQIVVKPQSQTFSLGEERMAETSQATDSANPRSSPYTLDNHSSPSKLSTL